MYRLIQMYYMFCFSFKRYTPDYHFMSVYILDARKNYQHDLYQWEEIAYGWQPSPNTKIQKPSTKIWCFCLFFKIRSWLLLMHNERFWTTLSEYKNIYNDIRWDNDTGSYFPRKNVLLFIGKTKTSFNWVRLLFTDRLLEESPVLLPVGEKRLLLNDRGLASGNVASLTFFILSTGIGSVDVCASEIQHWDRCIGGLTRGLIL